ncbi:hypothetical protein [Desmospora profundinema]|uniref:F0F1-type ATP synthase assembly protein I n=1 Tax=Desmospora profundinema TaxID=1571184 RepID=A0ABU1IQH5_9BACL|nr:hypothetical protein [Desmospora profundinema]MDR6227057.1 F0F1-type ATP synthase assembly protein I [Desmospora profundinema]
MVIKVLQSVGVGILICLAFGFILGLIGITSPMVVTVALLLLTYLSAGFVAGSHPSNPYLAAGLSGSLLVFFNQGFVILFLAPEAANNPLGLMIAFFVGVVLSLIGGLLGSLVFRRKLV